VARVLGRQVSTIVWRTFEQSDLELMAEYAGVPVVNALTDEFHPCQLLADLRTVRECKGRLAGVRAAFVGDGACNMGNSWVLAGASAGMHVVIGAPAGFARRRWTWNESSTMRRYSSSFRSATIRAPSSAPTTFNSCMMNASQRAT
jgi:ornithine carbamoyltransferase